MNYSECMAYAMRIAEDCLTDIEDGWWTGEMRGRLDPADEDCIDWAAFEQAASARVADWLDDDPVEVDDGCFDLPHRHALIVAHCGTGWRAHAVDMIVREDGHGDDILRCMAREAALSAVRSEAARMIRTWQRIGRFRA